MEFSGIAPVKIKCPDPRKLKIAKRFEDKFVAIPDYFVAIPEKLVAIPENLNAIPENLNAIPENLVASRGRLMNFRGDKNSGWGRHDFGQGPSYRFPMGHLWKQETPTPNGPFWNRFHCEHRRTRPLFNFLIRPFAPFEGRGLYFRGGPPPQLRCSRRRCPIICTLPSSYHKQLDLAFEPVERLRSRQ